MRIATRGSELALWQARHVAGLLAANGVHTELVIVSTSGDQRLDVPISAIGGNGVFVKEVQTAVLDGRADLAVHSAKDLPSSVDTPGLLIAAVPERADPRDALVGSGLEDLVEGATVATGSVRRQAQLSYLRPDLRFVSLRGNVPRRVERSREDGVDAVPVAQAALDRLGLAAEAAEVLDVDRFVPQVGQGALAIECRVDDDAVAEVARLEHVESRRAVDAERAFLGTLGGDCDLPVGAHGVAVGDEVRLDALMASHDGRRLVRDHIVGRGPEIGVELARRLLDAGGADILAARAAEAGRT